MSIRTAALTLAASLLATVPSALAAAEPDWGRAPRIEIDLSSFKYTPATVTLHHGQPYTLAFVNRSGGGHDYVAKRFFADATVAAIDKPRVGGGEVELRGGQSAQVRLIAPAPGRYEVHCSHFMHSTFGMTGAIVVD